MDDINTTEGMDMTFFSYGQVWLVQNRIDNNSEILSGTRPIIITQAVNGKGNHVMCVKCTRNLDRNGVPVKIFSDSIAVIEDMGLVHIKDLIQYIGQISMVKMAEISKAIACFNGYLDATETATLTKLYFSKPQYYNKSIVKERVGFNKPYEDIEQPRLKRQNWATVPYTETIQSKNLEYTKLPKIETLTDDECNEWVNKKYNDLQNEYPNLITSTSTFYRFKKKLMERLGTKPATV